MGVFNLPCGPAVLDHFRPSEFRGWADRMARDQLFLLDAFREAWGAPVYISPAKGALGRHAGESLSRHNYDRWGEVCATDVFPEGFATESFTRVHDIANRIGAGGFGIYTDTTYKGRDWPMVHIDCRKRGRDGCMATWSRVGGKYLGLAAVMPRSWAHD